MVVGTAEAVAIAVSIFLSLMGICVKILWDISNTLTETNTKIENIGNNVNSMSDKLTRTNELLIRQDERLKGDINRSDGGRTPSDVYQKRIDDYNMYIEPVQLHLSDITDTESNLPNASDVIVTCNDSLSETELRKLVSILTMKALQFFNVGLEDVQVNPQLMDDGFRLFMTLPTRDVGQIMEFLDSLEELQYVERIEKTSAP